MTDFTASLLPVSCHALAGTLSRRKALGALATLPLAIHAPLRAQDAGSLKIFQSTALTGPLADLGQAVHQGAKVYFAALDANGGINRPAD